MLGLLEFCKALLPHITKDGHTKPVIFLHYCIAFKRKITPANECRKLNGLKAYTAETFYFCIQFASGR